MSPLHEIQGNEMWFDEDADAEGSPGYYWLNSDGVKSDQSYHNEGDAIVAMYGNKVTFGGV